MGWFHRDLQEEIDRIIQTLDRDNIELPRDWQWVKKKQPKLSEIDALDVELMKKIVELHKRGLDIPELAKELFEKTRLLHHYLNTLKHNSNVNATTIDELINEIKKLYQQEANTEASYERLIVSTPYAYRLSHRTNKGSAEMIMKRGFGSFDFYQRQGPLVTLTGTADLLSEHTEQAIHQIGQRHRGNDVVVIIEIPKAIMQKAQERIKERLASEKASGGIPLLGLAGTDRWNIEDPLLVYYPDGTKNSQSLKPEYILGYAELAMKRIHMNPKYKNGLHYG